MASARQGSAAGDTKSKGLAASTLDDVEHVLLPLPDMHEDMPPSSSDLQISIKDLDALLSVYATLRSFSFLFRLSPFPLKTLCYELQKTSMSGLIDEIAVQLLKTIHDFPPEQEGDVADEGAVRYTGKPGLGGG